jgi:hypothetical protein
VTISLEGSAIFRAKEATENLAELRRLNWNRNDVV